MQNLMTETSSQNDPTFEIKRYKLGEGELIYIPKWAADPDILYREARKLSFTPEVVTMYGKENTIERQTVDYGTEYSYNQTSKKSIDWEPLALAIRQKLEQHTRRQLIQCACNHYVSPSAYIGAHCDKNTPIKGVSTPPNLILSLSLGSQRKMALRPIYKGQEGSKKANHLATMADVEREKNAFVLDLEPGSLVIFDGIVNHTWKHAVPKDPSASGERISLTYREFK
jgi:alkylated DNA repair dioxygenase AlkB